MFGRISHDSCMTEATLPTLRGGPVEGAPTTSAALILHGGREHGTTASSPLQLSYLRMLDFYWGLRKQARGCAVYLLRYRVRGWNSGGATPDPVLDARWALTRLREDHPDVPIGLLGHSMGARTAFAVAEQEAVVGVCGLAPWLPQGEPLPVLRPQQRFVIAHGTSDRMTSAPLSKMYAERLRRAGHNVSRFELPGAKHSMLDRPRLWHGFAVETTLGLVGDRPMPPGVAAGLDMSSGPKGLDLDLELDTFDSPL